MANDLHITSSTVPVHTPGQQAKEQISIRISHEVMQSVDQRALDRTWTRTDVIEDCLRREFGFGGLPWDNEDSGPAPSREEFSELEQKVQRLLGLAEDSGAL